MRRQSGPQVRPHMHALHQVPKKTQHQINVVAAVAEKLAAAQLFCHAAPTPGSRNVN